MFSLGLLFTGCEETVNYQQARTLMNQAEKETALILEEAGQKWSKDDYVIGKVVVQLNDFYKSMNLAAHETNQILQGMISGSVPKDDAQKVELQNLYNLNDYRQLSAQLRFMNNEVMNPVIRYCTQDEEHSINASCRNVVDAANNFYRNASAFLADYAKIIDFLQP